MENNQSGSCFIKNKDVKIYVEYANLRESRPQNTDNTNIKSEKDIPVVIMHGHTANRYYQYPLYNYFKDRNWPVVIFDLRGHGSSQKGLKKYTLKDTVEDLHQVYLQILKEKYNYDKFNLIGHSMGGAIAQLYALKYEQYLNKLVLLSTSAYFADKFMLRIIMRIGVRAFRKDYDRFVEKKRQDQSKFGLENFGHWEHPELRPDKIAASDFLDEVRKLDIRKEIEKIKVPTYIIVGSNDTVVPPRMSVELSRHIPHAKFEIMEGCVHNIAVDAKDKLSSRIEEFFISG